MAEQAGAGVQPYAERSDIHYRHPVEFERKIAAMCVQDPMFLHTRFEAVQPNYFKLTTLVSLVGMVRGYYETYRTIPDFSSASAILSDLIARTRASQQVVDDLQRELWSMFHIPVTDPDFVRDRTSAHALRQSLAAEIKRAIDVLDSGDDAKLQGICDGIQKASLAGVSLTGGTDVGGVSADLPRIMAESSTYNRRIPTGLPVMDNLLRGGLGPGELGIVTGSSGSGKSHALVNFGVGALMAGYTVLHVTLELKELDIALRYGSRMTGVMMDDILKGDPQYYQAVQSGRLIASDRLKVKYFPPGTASCNTIRALLYYLYSSGFRPGLLIVDYIKRMRHSGEIGSLGAIGDQLIALGDDFQLPVWSAQQIKREYRQADRNPLSAIANDITLIENADVGLGIAQTEQDHNDGVLRFEIGKARRGVDGGIVPCRVDYSRSTILEMSAEEAVAHMPQAMAPPPTFGGNRYQYNNSVANGNGHGGYG